MLDYSYNFIKFCGQELSVECSVGRVGYKAQSMGHAENLANIFHGLSL